MSAAPGVLRRRQQGVTAIEYALLASLIAVVIVGGGSLVGNNLRDLYDSSTSLIIAAISAVLSP